MVRFNPVSKSISGRHPVSRISFSLESAYRRSCPGLSVTYSIRLSGFPASDSNFRTTSRFGNDRFPPIL